MIKSEDQQKRKSINYQNFADESSCDARVDFPSEELTIKNSKEEDYVKLCPCEFFGLKPLKQTHFFCTSCDPFRYKKFCQFCYSHCHQNCTKLESDMNKGRDQQGFICYCGEKLHHEAVHLTKERKQCKMKEFDRFLENKNTYRCAEHEHIALCSMCYSECHAYCRREEISQDMTTLECQCKHLNHIQYESIVYIAPIHSYLNTINTRLDLFPVQVLNLLFSEKYPELSGIIAEHILSGIQPRENRFDLLVSMLSSSLYAIEFNTFYFSKRICEEMFPLRELSSYFTNNLSTKNITNQKLKFKLIAVFLFVHLKRDFRFIKSFTSADFFSNFLCERLEYGKFLSSRNACVKEFQDNLDLKLAFVKHIIDYAINCDLPFEDSKEDYEIFLKTITFLLKRLILDLVPLMELTVKFFSFHKKLCEYLTANITKDMWNLIKMIVEIPFLIAVNYNDILISNHLCLFGEDNSDYISNFQINLIFRGYRFQSFIHSSSSDEGLNEGRLLFQMAIENCQLLAKYQECKFVTDNTYKNKQHILQLSNETLKLFSLVDNFYFSQIISITPEDLKTYLEKSQASKKKITNPQMLALLEIKMKTEEFLGKLFINKPNEGRKDLITALEIIDSYFDNQIQTLLVTSTKKMCNYGLKVYPDFKVLSQENNDQLNLFVECLIQSQIDETLTKILAIFSNKNEYHSNWLTSFHVNNILSNLLLFFATKRGIKYFLTGKNVSRIVQTLINYINIEKHHITLISHLPADHAVTVRLLLEFSNLLMKRMKKFNIDLKGHKILFQIKNTFLEIAEFYQKGDDQFKMRLYLILKIFSSLADDFENEDFDEIKIRMASIFCKMNDQNYLSFTNFLKIFKRDSNGMKSHNLLIKEPSINGVTHERNECCGDFYDDNGNVIQGILNSKVYFAFILLISKNNFYIYEENEAVFSFIYKQDTNLYKDILSADVLCLKHRKIFIQFLRNFYFIDRINKKDYQKRHKYFTNADYMKYVYYIQEYPEMQQGEAFAKLVTTEEIKKEAQKMTPQDFEYLANKKVIAEKTLQILKIFYHEIETLGGILKNEKDTGKVSQYIIEILTLIRILADFFYTENDIWNLLFICYALVINSFFSNSDIITDEYMSRCLPKDINTSLFEGKTKLFQKKEYVDRLQSIELANDVHLYALVSHCLSEIFEITSINVGFDFSSFISLYDQRVELDFSSLALIQTKKLQHFYEIKKDHGNKKKSLAKEAQLTNAILQAYKEQFINIHNTHFFQVLGECSSGCENVDYSHFIIKYFIANMNSDHKFHRFSSFECMIYVMTKLFYFHLDSSKKKFKLIMKQEDIYQTLNKFKQILQENIVHQMALSKLCIANDKLLRVANVTKLTVQFLQIIANTEFDRILFALPIEGNEARSEDSKDDSIFEILKTNLISTYHLLQIDKEVNFEMPYDKLIVLLNNFISFIIAYIESPDLDIQDQVSQAIIFIIRKRLFQCIYYHAISDNATQEYQRRKNIICYIKIQIIHLLSSYLHSGWKSEKKKKLVLSLLNEYSPSHLFEEIEFNFQDLIKTFKLSGKFYPSDFDGPFLLMLENAYINNENFRESLQTQLCFKLFTLIKIYEDDYSINAMKYTFIQEPQDEYKITDNKLAKLSFYRHSDFKQKSYFFLSKMVMKVDVRTNLNENADIYFVRPPLTFFISLETTGDFQNSVPRSDPTSKLSALVKSSDFFMYEMMYNHHTLGTGLKHMVYKNLSFNMFHLVNYLFIILHNIILLIVYYRRFDLNERSYEEDVNPGYVPKLNLWLGIIQMCFLIGALSYSFYFLPISFQKDIMKYYGFPFLLRGRASSSVVTTEIRRFIKGDTVFIDYGLTVWDKIFLFFLFQNKIGIFLLTITLIIVFFITRHPIWLVLPIILVGYISPTLSSLFQVVRLQWWKISSILLFNYLCIYIFMWFGMFFLADLFGMEVLNVKSGENIQENYCHSTIQCLLGMIDMGVRSGGGIGDALSDVSYRYNWFYFIIRFLYVMAFHIGIILINGNVFLGIIVDTFADLRDQNESKNDDINNVCFICQLTRKKSFEKNIDFKSHRSEKHIMWNYIYFLTYLHIGNPHDFSQLEKYVWNKVGNQDISWIPIEPDT